MQSLQEALHKVILLAVWHSLLMFCCYITLHIIHVQLIEYDSSYSNHFLLSSYLEKTRNLEEASQMVLWHL